MHQVLVVGKYPFHQFAIYAAVVSNAVLIQVEGFATGGQLHIPAFGSPTIAKGGQPSGHLFHLMQGELPPAYIILGKQPRFLNHIVLNFAVGVDVYKAKHQLIGIALNAVAYMLNATHKVVYAQVWR